MRAGLLAIVLGAAACSTAPHPPGDVHLELGTVATDGTGFLPLDGDQPLIPGAQGGFHVWLKYRVLGMSAEEVTVDRTARRKRDNRLVLTTTGAQTIAPGADGAWETKDPLPSFMCPSPLGVQVYDETIVFDVKLTDAGGTVVEQQAEVTPHCPPVGDPQHDFCVQICSG